MASYEGRHAELYDLFYAGKDYEAEARFVAERLRANAEGPVKRVLDLACGTGRHAFALEAAGFEVTGADSAASMLAVADRAAKQRGARAKFHRQDLRSLDVPGAPFDAVTCLFDSLGYVTDPAGLDAALAGIARSVRPGGLFVLEFWHAPAMLRHFDPVRVRRWSQPTGEVLRISETTLFADLQCAEVAYTVYEHGKDGRFTTFREAQRNRFFHVPEMEGLLAHHGFAWLERFAGFTPETRVGDDTFHVVAVARRAAAPR